MAKGISSVREAIRTIEEKKAGGFSDGPRKFFLDIKDGETVVVRFLEDGEDFSWAWVHDVPPAANAKYPYPTKVVCIDQDEDGNPVGKACPGCERQYKRSFQGAINVIWRDAPVYATDENGKVIKDARGNKEVVDNKDQVALWVKGITVFEELIDLDVDFEGLSNRDFKITRTGEKLATRYKIKPVNMKGDGEPLSDNDLLLVENKFDLSEYVTPQSYDDWGTNPWDKKDEETTVETPSSDSPFARKRR